MPPLVSGGRPAPDSGIAAMLCIDDFCLLEEVPRAKAPARGGGKYADPTEIAEPVSPRLPSLFRPGLLPRFPSPWPSLFLIETLSVPSKEMPQLVFSIQSILMIIFRTFRIVKIRALGSQLAHKKASGSGLPPAVPSSPGPWRPFLMLAPPCSGPRPRGTRGSAVRRAVCVEP